jgi:predicted Rossmann-fold nucleotide-binding protein
VKLALIGSRRLAARQKAYAVVARVIDDHLADPDCVPLVILSGGAEGIDQMAAAAARIRGAQVLSSLEDLERVDLQQSRLWLLELLPACRLAGGRQPGHRCTFAECFAPRNMAIARACDKLVAVIGAGSTTYGSGWTRDRARDLGRPIQEVSVR